MAADVASQGRSWFEGRAKPSQAKPKRTLFGSTLERKHSDVADQLSKIDLSEQDSQTSQKQKGTELPKIKLPGVKFLEHDKEQLNQQQVQAERAKEMLNSLEEKSKYFNMKSRQSAVLAADCDERGSQWISRKDIERADDINKPIGLNEKGSYNHDRYGKKPPSHQYSLIGGLISHGMDFSPKEEPAYGTYPPEAYMQGTVGRPQSTMQAIAQPSAGKHLPPQASEEQNKRSKSVLPTTEDLPPHIRHQFGTKICRMVLSDPTKVQSTLENQKRIQANLQRTRGTRPNLTLPVEDTNPQYEALGLTLRQNVFPGYTYGHKNTTTKSTYTNQVHVNRVPGPDEYRCQRDELSTWAEKNVLRERMKKDWDSYLADAVKS